MELLFPKSVAHIVYELFEYQYIHSENENQLRLSGDMKQDEWLFSFLLAFGSDVIVQEPLHIKEELIRRHIKAVEHLQSRPTSTSERIKKPY